MIGIFDKKPDTDANFKAWLDENVNISQNLSKHDKSKLLQLLYKFPSLYAYTYTIVH